MSKAYKFPQLKITLAESGEVPKRVQLLRAGIYHDPRYGEFHVTKDMLFSMKKNFDENVLKIDINIDYAHESDKIAAGWIKKLELSEDGTELWATDVDWTPRGQKVLSDKEFRYLSADFTDDYIDNQTLKHYGPTLRGAGLTNRPVVKGMAAAVQLTEGKIDMKTIEELEEQIKKLAEDNRRLSDELASAKKDDENSGKNEADSEVSYADLKKKLDETMSENASIKKQLSAFEEKFGKMEADKKASEKKALFDRQLSEGKVVEAQREAFMKDDMLKFAELSQPVNLNGRGTGDVPRLAATPDDAVTEVREKAQKLLSEKKVSTLADGYSKVLSENPELKRKIYG